MDINGQVYKIDSWDDERLFVMVDGQSVDIRTWGTATGTTDICGDPSPLIDATNPNYNEHIVDVSVTVPHVDSTLVLQLVSSLDSWTGSWGLRDLQINLTTCLPSCLTCTNASACASCDVGLTLSATCQCSSGLLLVD